MKKHPESTSSAEGQVATAATGRWLVLLAVLVVAAFVVPFTVLSGIEHWYGSFLFWNLFALGVIAVIAQITKAWR